jgi:L-ascorbate metabolism protein UlaG (beta-lactamase superfamily)
MEKLEIIFHGQSCFTLERNGSIILIDPGKKKLGQIEGDIVYVTHRHPDHIAGVETFLNTNPNAILICNSQVADRFKKFKDRLILAKPGEELTRDHWKFKFVKARHGIFKNEENTGIIIESFTSKFGHAGDAVEFQNFSKEPMDLFAIPISGLLTASPKKALQELSLFQVPLPIIIPMHWLIRSTSRFCKKFKKKFPEGRCLIPKNGQKLDYS